MTKESQMKSLVLLGCNGNAFEILDAIVAINARCSTYTVIGYLDDDPSKHGVCFNGIPVLGVLGLAREMSDALFVLCIGSVSSYKHREAILSTLQLENSTFPTIIHPRAEISASATIEGGSFVGAFASIGSGALIGRNCIVLSHCIISHDSSLGKHSVLAAGVRIAGNSSIQDHCFLGQGALIAENVTVGTGTLIGMGSIIRSNVPSNSKVVGNGRFI